MTDILQRILARDPDPAKQQRAKQLLDNLAEAHPL